MWQCNVVDMLCCFRARVTCHNLGKHEFCSLPENHEGHIMSLVCELKLKPDWVMQQDNDPRYNSQPLTGFEWLKGDLI